MADTDSLDALERKIKIVSEGATKHPTWQVRSCAIDVTIATPALIAELRDLRSQLAESQRENEAMRDWFKRWDTEVLM
jgi:hypothetical protein